MLENDRTLPRYRRKLFEIHSKANLTRLRENEKALQPFTDKKIRSILRTFNELLIDEIINNRDGFALPYSMGKLVCAYFDNSKKSKDYKTMYDVKAKDQIGFKNWESDGFLAKIVYLPAIERFGFNHYYGFKATRTFTKKYSAQFKLNFRRFMFFTNRRKIRGIITNEEQLEKIRKTDQEIMINYDEFNFF